MMIDRWRDVVGCICPATEKLSPLSSRFLVSVHTTDLSPVGSWFLKLSAHTSCILSPVGSWFQYIIGPVIISEGAAPCPYWLAPCPIYTAPCPNLKKIKIFFLQNVIAVFVFSDSRCKNACKMLADLCPCFHQSPTKLCPDLVSFECWIVTKFWSYRHKRLGHSRSKLCPILCRLHTKLCPNFGRSRARLCPISFAPCPFPNPAGTLYMHTSFILSPVGSWFQYIQCMSYIVTYLLYPLSIRFLVSVQYLAYFLSSRFLVSVRTFRLLLSPVFHLHRCRSRSDNHLTRFQHLQTNIMTQLTTSVCTTTTHDFCVQPQLTTSVCTIITHNFCVYNHNSQLLYVPVDKYV